MKIFYIGRNKMNEKLVNSLKSNVSLDRKGKRLYTFRLYSTAQLFNFIELEKNILARYLKKERKKVPVKVGQKRFTERQMNRRNVSIIPTNVTRPAGDLDKP